MNSGKQPYKNLFQGIYLIAKNDGIIALAVKGLAPSLYFQFILNSCRLGIYTTAGEYGLTKKKDNSVSILKSALWGGIGGFMGQALATPFFMVSFHTNKD